MKFLRLTDLLSRPSLTTALFLIVSVYSINASESWSYEGSTGPDRWPQLNIGAPNQCGGRQQSPVDIRREQAVAEILPPLVMTGYQTNFDYVSLINDHYSARVLNFGGGQRYISGGPLKDRFVFDSFHLHWGRRPMAGSEHTFNGQQFAAEIHLVHYNTKYDNLSVAVQFPDGLCVLGILIEEGNRHLRPSYPLYETAVLIHSVWGQSSLTVGTSLSLQQLLPWNPQLYYYYRGSLTTPGCNEVVQWIVFRNILPAGPKTMSILRNFRDDYNRPVPDNWRPTQPLGGRIVRQSWRHEDYDNGYGDRDLYDFEEPHWFPHDNTI